MKKNFLSIALLIPGLLLLPACDWFGGDKKEAPAQEYKTGSVQAPKTAQEVVATIDGKPAVTADDFQRALEAAERQQPMIKQMLPMLPEDQQRMLYQQLLDQFVNRVLIHDYISEQGWDKTEEYKSNLAQAQEDLIYDLANVEFQNRILKDSQVSDAQAEKYYSANKATNRYFMQQPFLQEMGGVKSMAVKAKDKAQADIIAAAAKKSGDLRKAAIDMAQTPQDLGVVTMQSTEPDRLVVVKLLGMKSFPSTEVVEANGAFWVIQGLSKVDSKFAPYADVKDAVKEVVASENFQKRYLEELSKFKGKHKVDVNADFIEARIVKQQQPDTAAMAQAPLAQAQQGKKAAQ